MYNDTISNTMVSPLTNQFAVGVQINSESTADTSGESPMMAVILNNDVLQDSPTPSAPVAGVQRARTRIRTSTCWR